MFFSKWEQQHQRQQLVFSKVSERIITKNIKSTQIILKSKDN